MKYKIDKQKIVDKAREQNKTLGSDHKTTIRNKELMSKHKIEEGAGTAATIGIVGAMGYGAKKALDSTFEKTNKHNDALDDAMTHLNP